MRIVAALPDAHPTNGISIEFEIRPKFPLSWFKMYSTNHNKILHMSRQCNCCDMCKMSLWSAKQILNKSTPNFELNRNIDNGTGAYPLREESVGHAAWLNRVSHDDIMP